MRGEMMVLQNVEKVLHYLLKPTEENILLRQ